MITWRRYANGKHGVTLQEQELHLVNKVLRVTVRRFYQEVNLCYERDESENCCNSERILLGAYPNDLH